MLPNLTGRSKSTIQSGDENEQARVSDACFSISDILPPLNIIIFISSHFFIQPHLLPFVSGALHPLGGKAGIRATREPT
jgi:hypothetical protein